MYFEKILLPNSEKRMNSTEILYFMNKQIVICGFTAAK